MKRSDLYREYARVIDMCEGKGIPPERCVKRAGEVQCSDPTFYFASGLYTFAIGICEGTPVFACDVLYSRKTGDTHKFMAPGDFSDFTWTKPDPYAELKASQKAGKVIQLFDELVWNDITEPSFSEPPEKYRIKPEPVIVISPRCIYGIDLCGKPDQAIMCTWTDGILTNVEILK